MQKQPEIPVVYFDLQNIPLKERIVHSWKLITTGKVRVVIPAVNAKKILEDLRRNELIKYGKTEL